MKWLLQNVRRRAGFAIKNPRYTLSAMVREWEFETAYSDLLSGGLLISDDALWNNSFYDFARNIGAPEVQIIHGVGFLRKN